jgi:hypothetical protein
MADIDIDQIADATKCELFGDFGIFIQLFLGVISFSTLLVKRFTDKNRRSWTIWLMDTSKQAFSAGFMHFFNLIASVVIEETH